MLRKLGLEERAAAICQHKPGVSFTFNAEEQVDFTFQSLAGTAMPTYAYNAPARRSIVCSMNAPMSWA